MQKHFRILTIIIYLIITVLSINPKSTAFPNYPQEANLHGKKTIRNIKEAISMMLASSDPAKNEEGKNLQSLAFELNPTIYLSKGDLKNPFGKPAICLKSDVSTIGRLYEINEQFEQVELIIINLQQEKDILLNLNVKNLVAFPKLKYICISSSFTFCQNKGCEPSVIAGMISGIENAGITILYNISISE